MSNDAWNVELLRRNRVFQEVCATFKLDQFEQWPTRDDYNAWLADVMSPQDQPVRFVHQASVPAALRYEEIISREGLVPTRPGWHDCFNAVTWALFPAAKAEIYAAHTRLFNRAKAPGPATRRADVI